jgi:enoyl-CoA hydratase
VISEYAGLSVAAAEEGIVVATLDRPEKLNALSFDMFDSILEPCADVEREHAIRVVILTGAGRAFCAGLDLDAATALPSSQVQLSRR